MTMPTPLRQLRHVGLLLVIAFSGASLHAQHATVSMRVVVSQPAEPGKKSMASMKSTSIVAWLTPTGTTPMSERRAMPQQGYTLLQKDKQFTPHLLVVPTGSNVAFPNQDPFFHNVFSLFNGKRFDLGLYEAGSHRSVRFDREGVSYIFCNIHPEMGAVIVSLATPFYAVSGKDGTIMIANVPAGPYDLKLWSENVSAEDLAAAQRHIKVTDTDEQLGTIILPGTTQSVLSHKNKFGEDYKSSADKPY